MEPSKYHYNGKCDIYETLQASAMTYSESCTFFLVIKVLRVTGNTVNFQYKKQSVLFIIDFGSSFCYLFIGVFNFVLIFSTVFKIMTSTISLITIILLLILVVFILFLII